MPIIVCSVRDDVKDQVTVFDYGVDDFIAKPFNQEVLKARVRAVLRRTRRERPPSAETRAEAATGAPGPADPSEFQVGHLHVDARRRRAMLGGAPLPLTPIEYRLLAALASRPDEVLSRQELARLVWGYQDAAGIDRSLKVHVGRLRAKLAAGPVPAPPIVAVRGFGYTLIRNGPRRRDNRSSAA